MTTITWHPVSESLPDDDESVLLACEDGEVQCGFRDCGIWRYLDAMPIERCEVTHWAQFPDPPDAALAAKEE